MKNHLVVSALVLSSLAGLVSMQALRYETGTPSYEVHQTASMTMNGEKESDVTTFAKVALNITRDKGDTLNIVVDVDSISITTDSVTRSILPRGARTVMKVLNSGKIAVNPTDEDELGTLMTELFAVLPARASVGASVIDTIVEKEEGIEEMGIGSLRIIVTSRVVGDTTYDGSPAWKIEQSGNLVPIQKDSASAMGSMKMSVTGDMGGTMYISKSGTVLSAVSTGNVHVKMDLSMMGSSQTLDIKQAMLMNARKVR